MVEVLLGIGGNLGERVDMHRSLNGMLSDVGIEVVAASSLYWNKAEGFEAQTLFANRVLMVRTSLLPIELLHKLKKIEQAAGRVQSDGYTSRTIDLDILLYDQKVINDDSLTIPHRRMLERAFVLVPACEVAPGQLHPVTGRELVEHLADLSS